MNHHRTMSSSDPTPEEQPRSPQEGERLDHMHRQLIDSQEAWRRLLENLDRVKRQNANAGLRRGSEKHKTEKPSE
jgi:hypothetical protein